MNYSDRKILTSFAQIVRSAFPDAKIWAFGSRARGTATKESDLDVCVVIDKLTDDSDKKVIDSAWEIGFENDVVISTVTYSREEFDHGSCASSPLVTSIKADGIPA